MKPNIARKVIVHGPTGESSSRLLAARINAFHVEIIERRLNNSSLTTKQKVEIINTILESIKLAK